MSKLSYLLMASVALVSLQVNAAKVDETPIGEAVERHLPASLAIP